MVAQMHRAGRTTETGPLVRRGLWVALPMVVMAMLMLRHAGGVFVLMEVIPQVASIASNYLKAIAWGLPAAAVFFILRNLSEGMSLARPGMLILHGSIRKSDAATRTLRLPEVPRKILVE